MEEQTLALNDRVQVIGDWPKGAKGKVAILIGGRSPIVRVDFDHPHRIEECAYPYSWYKPEQIQRLQQAEEASKS